MSTRDIKTIIFDAEGVIVDTEALWDRSQEILMARRGLRYDRSMLKPLMAGRSVEEGVEIMKKHYHLNESVRTLSAERKQLIGNLFEHDIEYINGFPEFLRLARQKNLSCGVATSMDPDLMVKVEKRLPIRALFEGHVYHVADAGNLSKPDPAVFLYAAGKLGSEPGQCLVIEDAPHGIAAAKNAGMSCWALTTTFNADLLQDADGIFENYSQIAEQLF